MCGVVVMLSALGRHPTAYHRKPSPSPRNDSDAPSSVNWVAVEYVEPSRMVPLGVEVIAGENVISATSTLLTKA